MDPDADDAPPPGGADRRPLLTGLTIGAVMLLVALVIAVGGHRSHDDESAVAATGGGERTVGVKLVDLDIVPGEIRVDPGTRLILDVKNDGAMRHDLSFPGGPATRMLDRGGSQRLDLGTVTAGRTGWCTVPGHKQAGMTLSIQVTGGQGAPADHADHGAADGHAAADERDATIDPNASPLLR